MSRLADEATAAAPTATAAPAPSDLRAAYDTLVRTLEEKERDLVLAGELGQALLARYDRSEQTLEACRQQVVGTRTASQPHTHLWR
jgi:hypothetical protein